MGRPRLAKGFVASVAAPGPDRIRGLRKPLRPPNGLRRWYHVQREMGRRPRERIDCQGCRRVGPRIGCQRHSTADDRPIRPGLDGRQIASSTDAGRRRWIAASTGPIDPGSRYGMPPELEWTRLHRIRTLVSRSGPI